MKNFYNPTPDYYNDYIAHHGIIGQSWGHRNGPPYPLDSSKSTGSRLKNEGSVKKTKPLSKHKVKKIKKDFLDYHGLGQLNGMPVYINGYKAKKHQNPDKPTRYITMTIRTKTGQDDYTIDTKHDVIVAKDTRDRKGNHSSASQLMSDKDIASGRELLSELKKKQQKQWDRDYLKESKEMEKFEEQIKELRKTSKHKKGK